MRELSHEELKKLDMVSGLVNIDIFPLEHNADDLQRARRTLFSEQKTQCVAIAVMKVNKSETDNPVRYA